MDSAAIPFHLHDLGKIELEALEVCFDGPMLTTGPATLQSECDFAAILGAQHCIAVSSCTAALHLALEAVGVGPGDEVLVPGVTFAASALAVLHAGATPVLVDVRDEDGLLDLDLLQIAMSSRTKAVIPVHLYGQMVDMVKLSEFADRYDLTVIEDAAHAIEAERAGVRPGQLSAGAAFSFYATKNLTCGEGGAFVTSHAELSHRLRLARTHGMTKTAADRLHEGFQPWDIPVPGWKYNMDDIHASILAVQLPRLPSNWARRRVLATRYRERFGGNEAIRLPHLNEGTSALHLYPIRVAADVRPLVMRELQKAGIGFSVHYPPLRDLGAFKSLRQVPHGLPVSTNIGMTTISLPLYPRLTEAQVDRVAEAVLSVVN